MFGEIEIPEDAYMWTNHGIKKPGELTAKDLVLGYDAKRQRIPCRVRSLGLCDSTSKVAHVLLDRGEIMVPASASIPCFGGPLCAAKLGDPNSDSKRVETIQGAGFLKDFVPSKPVSNEEARLAFLDGLLYRRIPGIDQNIVRVANVDEKELRALFKRLQGMLGLVAKEAEIVGSFEDWAWILIPQTASPYTTPSLSVPERVRHASIQTIMWYIRGFLNVAYQDVDQDVEICTFLEEEEVRRLFFSLATYLGTAYKCVPNSKTAPTHVSIKIDREEWNNLCSGKPGSFSGYTKTSTRRIVKKRSYKIAPEAHGWQPILDNVGVHFPLGSSNRPDGTR